MRLAESLRLGPVTLRNRIVGAPMERNYCALDGTVTGEYADYLEARAAGGAALVFTEASYVRVDGKGRVRQMGVDDDRQVPGIARLVRTIHRHGTKLGVELNHGGRTAQRPRRCPACPQAVTGRPSWTTTTSTTSSSGTERPRAAAGRRAWTCCPSTPPMAT